MLLCPLRKSTSPSITTLNTRSNTRLLAMTTVAEPMVVSTRTVTIISIATLLFVLCAEPVLTPA